MGALVLVVTCRHGGAGGRHGAPREGGRAADAARRGQGGRRWEGRRPAGAVALCNGVLCTCIKIRAVYKLSVTLVSIMSH